ncbi:MAG: hypothetical protein WCG42_01115 [Parachlamydiaceae bacterium]
MDPIQKSNSNNDILKKLEKAAKEEAKRRKKNPPPSNPHLRMDFLIGIIDPEKKEKKKPG